jgi:hypothetical protein
MRLGMNSGFGAGKIARKSITKHGNDFDAQFLSFSELFCWIKGETKYLNCTGEVVHMTGV